jgi:calcium-dependent protein kinase
MKFLPSFGCLGVSQKDENVMARPLQLNHGICTMGKKSKHSSHDKNHVLAHVDRLGLEEIRESLIAEGKRAVRMESPLGEAIEQVYDGVHNGRVLGTGAAGLVRRVTHRKTGVDYAVKIVDLSKYTTEKRLTQLKTEVRIGSQVNHTNIIRLEEVYESDTHLYLVQELCTGGDLFDYLKSHKNGHLPEDEARGLVKQLLSAIKYLHAHHILHGDIKLENFLLTSSGILKMIDFGVARYFTPGQLHCDVVGTPYSIAPEVVRRCHSERSDVWSVGVLAFALLSGKTPFGGCDGGDLNAVRKNILDGNFSFDDPVWETVSSSARAFIVKVLESDVHKRPSEKHALMHEWIKQPPTVKPAVATTSKSQAVFNSRVSTFKSAQIYPVFSMYQFCQCKECIQCCPYR